MNRREIAVARGDGIGPEIMDVVLRALAAVDAPLSFVDVEMGAEVWGRGIASGIAPEARAVVERTGVLLKGPMAEPKGVSAESANRCARQLWSAFARKRVFRSFRGVESRCDWWRDPVDLTVICDALEDTHGAIEHLQTQDVAQCRRIVTRPGSERLHRYAFEVAVRKGAKRITCGHHANVMRLTDGLFLEAFYEVAEDYPQIRAEDVTIDQLAMRLVMTPQELDVLVLPNLQGDIIGDLCAGLVGGLGYAPAANVGDDVQIFEAAHGPIAHLVGQDRANPTALLLGATMMLRHLGLFGPATHLEDALEQTLTEMGRAPDLGHAPPPWTTSRFAEVLLDRIAHTRPAEARVSSLEREGVASIAPIPRTEPVVMRSELRRPQATVGVDLFVESGAGPAELAERLGELSTPALPMTLITNRGTTVWPGGSAYTACVDQYCVRFLGTRGAVSAAQLLRLAEAVSERVRLCSLEMLLDVDGRPGFGAAATG